MERYFFVAYTYVVNNINGNGNANVITRGKYLNRKQFIDEMKDRYGFNEVLITNIIELTESDYNDYIR